MQQGTSMSEEENVNVEEVVQPSETDQVQDEAPQAQAPQKGSKEYNFAEQRRIIEQQNRKIQELEEAVRYGVKKQPEPEDDLEHLGQDEFLTRSQAEKLALKKAQELLAQQEASLAEDRMRLKFKDYDDVVTEENVKELIGDDRELADSIASSPNPYAAAYKLIKKAAFYQEKGKKKSQEAEKIVKNAQKPISSNSVQARPLAAANTYAFASDGEREALYKEMMEYARRRN